MANGLSLIRIALTPLVVVLLLWQAPTLYPLAALVCLIALLSDVLDGYFARRRASVSKLGIFLDLIADKILTATVLVAFVDLELLPTWPVAVILGREFIITGLRTVAAAEGMLIPAAAWGKQKTLVTGVAIMGVIIETHLRAGGSTFKIFGFHHLVGIAPWLMHLAVLLTVTSGLRYIYSARGFLHRFTR